MVGREAIRTWLDMVFQHIDRIEVNILNIASNGEWVLNERKDDHIAGEAHMVVEVMNATRIVDGQIVLFREYYDRERCKEVGLG
jgi:limonene-1,2-epoxide hydrolase